MQTDFAKISNLHHRHNTWSGVYKCGLSLLIVYALFVCFLGCNPENSPVKLWTELARRNLAFVDLNKLKKQLVVQTHVFSDYFWH